MYAALRLFVCVHVTSVPHQGVLGILQRVLVALQNALLDELVWVGSAFQPLLEAVRPHVKVQFLLVALQGRRGGRVGKDVALDEVVAGGTLVEALLEVVCCALALEL